MVDTLIVPGSDRDAVLRLVAAGRRQVGASAGESDRRIRPAIASGRHAAVTDVIAPSPGKGVLGDQWMATRSSPAPQALLDESSIDIRRRRETLRRRWAADARTVVFAAIDGQAVAAFAIADTLRAEAPAVVASLTRRGLRVVMLSGDRRAHRGSGGADRPASTK